MPNEFVELRPSNIRVWFLLAFQAGAVNAGGFLACGRFVTHTTGFATYFGVDLAGHHEGAALGMLSVPVFFLLGAMFTAYCVELELLKGRRAQYTLPSALISLCLAAALLLGVNGAFGNFKQEMIWREDYLLLVLLSLASGLQNALVTNSQGVVVRTTHMTGMTTDLGVGLVRALFAPGPRERDRKATFARAGIIASFTMGSAASAYLYLRVQFLGFLLPFLTSLFLLIVFVQRTRKKETL